MAPPPHAEFLLHTPDSVFWVSTGGGKVHVRGEPLTLARYDGHFYEVYSVDDDFSYDDALLLGDRLYRRDLTTGDSSVVFADTVVSRIALAYARAHPDERPLGPDQDGEANPATSATAEVDVLGIFGPYLSFEYHVDVAQSNQPAWHATRRGVIDLRTGRQSSLADLFGAAEGQRITDAGRATYAAIRDSVAHRRSAMEADQRRAADALAREEFDDRSFAIEGDDGDLTVTFDIPGRGDGAAGNLVELDPVRVDGTAWWRAVRDELAQSDTSETDDTDRWTGPGYTVIARYDTSGKIAHVSIGDSTQREWSVATVTAPLSRVDWLDRPALGDGDRRALMRAFNQAATYDEKTRVAFAAPDRHVYVRPVSLAKPPRRRCDPARPSRKVMTRRPSS